MSKIVSAVLLLCINVSALIRIDPLMPSIKYIQGVHYNAGSLYFGTNRGEIVCVRKDDTYNLYRKWMNVVTKRGIRKIKSTSKYVLVDCDANSFDETGRTVLCSIDDGKIVDQQIWRDSTVFEHIVKENEWVRCSYDGTVVSKMLNQEDEFVMKCRIPLMTSDYVTTSVIYDGKMYLVTLNGFLWIIDMNDFKIINRYQLNFYMASSMTVDRLHSTSSSVFIYIGNQKGNIYFINMKDDTIICHTEKVIHNGVVTHILSNRKDVFVAYHDKEIFQFDMLSFDPIHRMKMNTESYANIDSLSLSPRGLFFISDNERELMLYPLVEKKSLLP